MNAEKLNCINDKKLLRLTGVKRSTFKKMLYILKEAEQEKFKKGGKPNKLSLESRIFMTLSYWREYRTYFHAGEYFNISESSCYKNIKWIEDVLIKHPGFRKLAGQKALLKADFNNKIIIVDVTESAIQRPKNNKKQQNYYSGKKKKHTIKTQVIIEKESKTIIATNFAFGKMHDFRLFKESKLSILKTTQIIADSGYQGAQEVHSNVLIPKKKSKKNPLTEEQKENNKQISSIRIVIEHVFAVLKRFKIITEKYRNRRKRFGLRFNLIASIYNLQLSQ